jgi:AMP-polyphosphate phosphotransferase
MGRLDELDLLLSLSKKEEAKRLASAYDRLATLRLALGGKLAGYEDKLGPPVCVMFEGWDASGKGGAIKRLVAPLDPRHVRVAQFAAPTRDEKRHHFLRRFWPVLPGRGGMAVLDRSWYGRVLVERVEGFATPEEVERSYDEIVAFERSLCAEGTVLVKFWLHLSEDEQLRRFRKREKDPLRQWKLTDEDWRNRSRRADYTEAIEVMFERTETEAAPWHAVPAESKHYARVEVIETVIAEIERGMRDSGFRVPAGALTVTPRTG